MKNIFIGIFLFNIFVISTTYADVVSVAKFKALPQEQSNWCWAASIQSIFLTEGLTTTQSSIVTAAYGAPMNKTAPGFGGTLTIINGLKISVDRNLWEVSASAGNSFPNSNWLYSKLSNNKPVMIWYQDQFSNHSIVINGGVRGQA